MQTEFAKNIVFDEFSLETDPLPQQSTVKPVTEDNQVEHG